MPTGREFTPEQWQEIEAARERLWRYKLKVQPYPALPLELDKRGAPPLLETAPQWERPQWQYIQQLRAQVNYLNNKVTEMRAEKKKPKRQKITYKGIK